MAWDCAFTTGELLQQHVHGNLTLCWEQHGWVIPLRQTVRSCQVAYGELGHKAVCTLTLIAVLCSAGGALADDDDGELVSGNFTS